jgi:2-Cys peroxiredoxin 5
MGQKACGMMSGRDALPLKDAAATQPRIAVGDKIPAITIDHGFNPIGKVNMSERLQGKKVIIMGLPGAFTPC